MRLKQKAKRAVSHLTKIGALIFEDQSTDENTVLLLSSGRSGSTWLGDLLQTLPSTRVIFEPLHPKYGQENLRDFRYTYLSPGSERPDTLQALRGLLEGSRKSLWTEQFNSAVQFRYKRRLLKEVRANLLFPWLQSSLPGCRFIILVRHPAAVVASQLPDWQLSSRRLLEQGSLNEVARLDRFSQFGWPESGFGSNMVFWAIENRVALEHALETGAHVVFYEDLCLQPRVELERIERFLSLKFTEKALNVLSRSSWSSHSDVGLLSPEEKISRWRSKVAPDQIDLMLRILGAAGLDGLYGTALLPNRYALNSLRPPPCT